MLNLCKRLRLVLAAGLFAAAGLAGCAPQAEPAAAPVSPYPHPRSVVVFPLLNHSPSDDFDVLVATDTLVDELSQFEGLVVLPTNRPLQILLQRGQTHPTSLEQAREITAALGADGMILGAVNEYHPYRPMKLGMTLQLYWIRADMNSEGADPVTLSRTPAGGEAHFRSPTDPVAQAHAVIDAGRNDVTERVRAYSAWRQGVDSAYGWRRYLVDRQAFLQFVCHEMSARLMAQELDRITMKIGPGQGE